MQLHAVVPAVALLTAASAQLPILAPTSNVWIATGSVLHYQSIAIPASVTVTFTGTQPALVQCDGDVVIDGTMSVASTTMQGWGPGSTTAGWGQPGSWCPPSIAIPATSGRHAGLYGSVFPFSTLGGSAGGPLNTYVGNPLTGPCSSWGGAYFGGGSGGTLVLCALGTISIHGTITANGGAGDVSPLGVTYGSGGSILIAGLGGVHLFAGGSVTATDVNVVLPGQPAAQGYVRFDAGGVAPLLQGTVAPTPAVVELPYLRVDQEPTIGAAWSVHAHAPANETVLVALASQPIAPTPTPFGLLGVDPTQIAIAGLPAMPNVLVDPYSTVSIAVPANPQLIGLTVYLQGIAVIGPHGLRLSNLLSAVIH